MKQFFLLILFVAFSLYSYSQVNEVTIAFIPSLGGDTIVAKATLSNAMWSFDASLALDESSLYEVSINLNDQQANFEGRLDEIQFFYDGQNGLFDHSLEYLDQDANDLPVGFSMEATTACVDENLSGFLNVTLVDFGSNKSEGSMITDGQTIFEIEWPVQIILDPDAPPCENEEEIITEVILTWTSELDTVVARAQDPDGEGPLDLEILDEIDLLESTEYQLSIQVMNSIEGEDITEEIMQEADEHMFFFAFTEGIFSDPPGDGNVDSRGDSIHYLDFDENDLPVGLSTQWSTQTAMGNGTFRIVLKHQPDVKSATSTIDDGGTDIDLTFNLGSTPTAIRDFIAPSNQLEIRPNPVVDYLEWNFKEGIKPEVGQIQILDLYGRALMQVDQREYMVNTGQLPAGQYVLKIAGRHKIWIKRFVKE